MLLSQSPILCYLSQKCKFKATDMRKAPLGYLADTISNFRIVLKCNETLGAFILVSQSETARKRDACLTHVFHAFFNPLAVCKCTPVNHQNLTQATNILTDMLAD